MRPTDGLDVAQAADHLDRLPIDVISVRADLFMQYSEQFVCLYGLTFYSSSPLPSSSQYLLLL